MERHSCQRLAEPPTQAPESANPRMHPQHSGPSSLSPTCAMSSQYYSEYIPVSTRSASQIVMSFAFIRTQTASSESSTGMYVFNVFSAYTDAERRLFVTFIPSIRTRRSKAWLKKLGSIRGAVDGSFECSRTVPLLWGFISRQMAPINSVSCSAMCPTKEGGVCYHIISRAASCGMNYYGHILWQSQNRVLWLVSGVYECAQVVRHILACRRYVAA
jgi:hypothetical protein